MNEFRLIWEKSLRSMLQYAEDDCSPAPSMEDDCACPDDSLMLTQAYSPSSAQQWQVSPTLYRAGLSSAYEMAINPLSGAGVVVFDTPVRNVLDTFATPRWPGELPALLPGLEPRDSGEIAQQLGRVGLLVPTGSSLKLERAPLRTLNVWMHVTNACNLDCPYCYVNKTGERMSESTGRAAVQAAFRTAAQHGFRAVKIKYAGGEPTLNFPLVETLHQHVRQVAAERGLESDEIVLTNGVGLTDAIAERLRENGIRLMVSLDGVGSAHDRHRQFKDGRGSFERVARGIDRALAHGLVLQLMITISARNADGLSDVVGFALDRDIPFRINFYRNTDRGAGDLGVFDPAQLVASLREAFALIEARMPKRRVIGGLLDRSLFIYPHEHSCAVDHGYLVIDPQGRVARCQMTIDQPVTTVWADDPLLALQNAREGFHNLAVDERQGCQECTWRYWCGGGCSLLTHRATGHSDTRSPYCDVYKALYPDVIRLEGLRLLKWNTPTD